MYRKEKPTQIPDSQLRFSVRPASPDEAGLFYALPKERDEELGCVGHVRIDFGRSGGEFWHTWWQRGDEGLNTPEFRSELGQVVDELRESVLSGIGGMKKYCRENGGAIEGGYVQNYGYVVETERYRYCLRCSPVQGDYNAYLTCFDTQAQRLEQSEDRDMAMGGMA